MLLTLLLLAGFLQSAEQVEVALKFVEIDGSDYDVVKAELKAGRLGGDFEGLNMSAVTPGFWKKIQTFPGADVLSAPKVTVLTGQQARIEVGQEVAFAEEFLENGDPAGPLQTRFVGLRATITAQLQPKGVGLSLDVSAVDQAGQTEVPHGTVPIFQTRALTTRVTLPEDTPAMIGGFTSDGRRTLIICQAKTLKNKDTQK